MTLREFIDVTSSDTVLLDAYENQINRSTEDIEESEVIDFWIAGGHIEVLTNYHPSTREEDDAYNIKDINFL